MGEAAAPLELGDPLLSGGQMPLEVAAAVFELSAAVFELLPLVLELLAAVVGNLPLVVGVGCGDLVGEIRGREFRALPPRLRQFVGRPSPRGVGRHRRLEREGQELVGLDDRLGGRSGLLGEAETVVALVG